MPTAVSEKGQINAINNMRGIAAAAVMLFHFIGVEGYLEALPALKAVARYGEYGVDMFFVISGFVLPYSLYRARYTLSAFGRFVAKRLLRLEPPYLVSLALTVAAAFALGSVKGTPLPFTPGQLLLHLGYLNAFFQKPWLSTVYWTLSVEFQYYLLLGLLYPLLVGPSAWPRRGLLVALLAAAFAAHRLPRDFFFPHAPVFVCGMAAFLYYVDLIGLPEFRLWLLASAVSMAALGAWPEAATALVSAGLIFRFGVRHPTLTFLGNVSYSLYLLHNFAGPYVLSTLRKRTDNPALELLGLILAIGLSLGLSWLLYRWVEQPSQRAASRLRYAAPAPAQP